MKFVIAPDSFKESMSAVEVANAIEKGVRKVFPESEIKKVPMADGGEGTTHALINATEGRYIKKTVRGPFGEPVEAIYGLLGDGTTAVIEMAQASGLHLVPSSKRNPMITTTYGTGELIMDALDQGINEIILGIGGSASNDGGVGMAKALGYEFLDSQGRNIVEGGGGLSDLETIKTDKVDERLSNLQITVASDVDNPLYGSNGASAVFGPQKGATKEMVKQLDRNLQNLDRVIQKDLNKSIGTIPGSGAAGGLGAGLLAFTNSSLERGVDIIIEKTELEEVLRGADVCLTGEGQIDFQTKYGKAPYGVLQTAKYIDKDMKVIAIAGAISPDSEELYHTEGRGNGFDGIFGIAPCASTLDDLLNSTEENIIQTIEAVCRVLK